MRGGMRFSRWSALLEKMISTRRISVPSPLDRRISAGNRMSKFRQRNGSLPLLPQGPSSENSYRGAFAKV
jgi:hypothetical protein